MHVCAKTRVTRLSGEFNCVENSLEMTDLMQFKPMSLQVKRSRRYSTILNETSYKIL